MEQSNVHPKDYHEIPYFGFLVICIYRQIFGFDWIQVKTADTLCKDLGTFTLSWREWYLLLRLCSLQLTSWGRRKNCFSSVDLERCKHRVRTLKRLFFTFSEPCILIHIREKDQNDAHFFYNSFHLIYPRHVSNNEHLLMMNNYLFETCRW
jgi:hypothetical protein